MEDYYSILGLEKTASQAEIRAAYRKLAQQWHPDKEGGDEATFKKVGKAYETLGNEEKRKAYDEGGGQDTGERTPHSAAIQGLDALIERFGAMEVNLIEAIKREI